MKGLSIYTLSRNLIVTSLLVAGFGALSQVSAQVIAGVNVKCGNMHMTEQSRAPSSPTELCAKGIPSAVSGNGPWNWICSNDKVGLGLSEEQICITYPKTCTNTPVCTDSTEQIDYYKCVNDNNITDPLEALNSCALKVGMKTCSENRYHCSDFEEQEIYNECILNSKITTTVGAQSCVQKLELNSCTPDPIVPCDDTCTITPVCTDPVEQSYYNECAIKNGLNPATDGLTLIEICARDQKLYSCSTNGMHCSDKEEQSIYRDYITTNNITNPADTLGWVNEMIGEGRMESCKQDITSCTNNTATCGTIKTMPMYGPNSRPSITPTNYCAAGTRLTTRSVLQGTNGCTSAEGCAQWTCEQETEQCTVTPTCTDPNEETQYQNCLTAKGIDPTTDIQAANFTCILSPKRQTCSLLQNHCTNIDDQNLYNIAIDYYNIDDHISALNLVRDRESNIISHQKALNLSTEQTLESCTPDIICPDPIVSTCTVPYVLPNEPGVCGSLNGSVIQDPSIIKNIIVVQEKGMLMQDPEKIRQTSEKRRQPEELVDVVLSDIGNKGKVPVIKLVSEVTELSLSKSKTIVDNLGIIEQNITSVEAIQIAELFDDIGAKVATVKSSISANTSIVTNQLCSVGTPFLPMYQTIEGTNGTITIFTWTCLGIGKGSASSSCIGYMMPKEETCMAYDPKIQGSTNLANISFPNDNIAVVLDARQDINEFGVDYTTDSTFMTTGVINSNSHLLVRFKNLNKRQQSIQYRKPILNPLAQNNNGSDGRYVGGEFFGCQSSGWNISNPIQWSYINPLGGIATTSPGTSPNTALNAWFINSERGGLVYENNIDSQFWAWNRPNKGFNVSCEVCIGPQTPTMQTGACIGLPANAQPHIATGIVQYLIKDNTWVPSTEYIYNTEKSTTNCNFICKPNYTRDSESNTCKPDTKIVQCTGTIPKNTDTISTSYLQTRTPTGRTPTGPIRYEYICNEDEPGKCKQECSFVCKENYTRDSTTLTCVADDQPLQCNGTIPSNATLTNGTKFIQNRNGSSWIPSTMMYTHGASICGFSCNTNYTRNAADLSCVADTRTIACNGVQPANTNPTNGVTFIQTRNGSNWTPSTGSSAGTWTLSGTNTCGYTCQNGYARNGSSCQLNPGNSTPTYSRYTGDWSACTLPVTGANIYTGYTWDISNWGACSTIWSTGTNTCIGNYTGMASNGNGSCSNEGGYGILDLTQCGLSQGNFYTANMIICVPLSMGSGPSSTSLTTCQQATTQNTCIGESVTTNLGNTFGPTTSGGIAGCSRIPAPVTTSCNGASDAFSCTFMKPGCTWHTPAPTHVSSENRTIVCRNQLGNIVHDSFCTQPKPALSQPCSLTSNSINGICGTVPNPAVTFSGSNITYNTNGMCAAGNLVNDNREQIFGTRQRTCEGINGGTHATCGIIPQPPVAGTDAVCGTIGGTCSIGTPSDDICLQNGGYLSCNSNRRTWSCNSTNGGNSVSCPTNSVCKAIFSNDLSVLGSAPGCTKNGTILNYRQQTPGSWLSDDSWLCRDPITLGTTSCVRSLIINTDPIFGGGFT